MKLRICCVFIILFISNKMTLSQYGSPCISSSRIVDWSNVGFLSETPNTADNVINNNNYSGSDYDKIVAAINDANYLSEMTIHSQNTKVDSPKIFKNMVFFGGNYSQFTTTDGVGKSGMNFGFYRQSNLWKKFSLNYGIMYTKKRLDLLDKKIRLSDEYSYSENSDIHLDYNILELNILGSYAFRATEEMFINPIIGIGYALFFSPRSNIDASESIYQDNPVEDYDYRMAFTDGPPVVFNSGWINHLGLKVSIKQYYVMMTYTNYLKMLPSAGKGDLILNEKIHSFNVLIGVYF